MSKEEDSIEEVFTAVGYGRWQLPVLATTLLIHTVFPVFAIGSILLSAPVAFRCSWPNSYFHSSTNHSIGTTMQGVTDAQELVYDSECGPPSTTITTTLLPSITLSPPGAPRSTPATQTSEAPRPTGLPSCPLVQYDTSVFSETIISEFNLICERSKLRPLYQMMFSVAGLVGSPIGGVISDRYGRRMAIRVGSLVNLAGVVAMALCPWYLGVLLARFFLGVSAFTMLMPAYGFAQEITPLHLRTVSGMLLGTAFSLAMVILAGLGFLIRSWRLLLLASCSPLVIIIPLSFLIGESPRWLVQKRRGQEAARLLDGAAQCNRIELAPSLISTIEKLRETKTSPQTREGSEVLGQKNLVDWLRAGVVAARIYLGSPAMRVILIMCPIVWFLQGFLYYGVMLNANNFTSNDPFVYVAMSGVLDAGSIFLFTPVTLRVGRCITSGVSLLLAGTLLILDMPVPANLWWIKWSLVMGGVFLTAGAYQVKFIHVAELFPTVIRSRGFGMVGAAGNLGKMLAPVITDLMVHQAWWVPSVTFGGAGILTGLLMPCLPETANKPLPETVQDVEAREKGQMANFRIHNKQKRKLRQSDGEVDDETVIPLA